MCGISGIIDQQPVTRNLVTSIGNLEYRGYDSCGMALLNGKGIEVRKNTGGVQEVRSREKFDNMTGNLGIAHTRWATHGGVTAENAHPHLSQSGDFAIVHNGIISNYQKIRERLIGEGIEFNSTPSLDPPNCPARMLIGRLLGAVEERPENVMAVSRLSCSGGLTPPRRPT